MLGIMSIVEEGCYKPVDSIGGVVILSVLIIGSIATLFL